MKPVAVYSLYPWEHRLPFLRLVAPWQAAGVKLQFGTQWDQIILDLIPSAGLIHIHRDFPRLAKAYHQIIEGARAANIPVIVDLDDDLFHMPPDHPDRQFHYRSDALFPVLQAIVEADAVTVSTPELFEMIQPLNPDTRLLPSYLDDHLWSLKAPPTRKKKSPLIVGWINDQPVEPGGFVRGVERFLRRAGENVLLRVWGAKPPPPLLDLTNVDWLPELPPDYSKYLDELYQQKCDLMVVPRSNDPYYHSMSPERFFEISACGIPGIFSRVPPYQDIITHQENGWLADAADEWEGALDLLHQSEPARTQAVENAQETVRSDGLLSRHTGGWLSLYEDLTSRTVRSKQQKSLDRQAADLAGQVREWQQDLEEQIRQRDWEVRALNVTLKRKEREASQRIEQLDAQLHEIWESRTWQLLDKIRHPTRLFSASSHSSQQPVASPPIGQEIDALKGEATSQNGLTPARNYDVVLMVGPEWDADSDLNHWLVESFTQQGSRVFCINPSAPASAGFSRTETGMIAIKLPRLAKKSIGDTLEAPVSLEELRQFFEQLRLDANIEDAICWVEDAAASDLAFCLRNWFNWKVVFTGEPADRLIQERSDLVLTPGAESGLLADLQQAIPILYPTASLIVLTYNNLNYTRQCLESIYAKTSYPVFEVVVVDNASTDGTQDFLHSFAETHTRVKLVLNPENRGFAAGNNQGVEAATGEYLVFINNDIVVTPGWLSRLVSHLRDPQVGAVGPVTNYAGNESRIAVDYSDITGLDDFARRYTHDHIGHTFEIRMLALFCLAVRRSIIETVGLLDERFKVGMYEDDDFSLRMRQKGYHILCAEDVYIHHWGSASFSQLEAENYQRLHRENRSKFEEKWGTHWQAHRGRMDESEPG